MRFCRLIVIPSLLLLLLLMVTACNPFSNKQNQNQQQKIPVVRGDLIVKANGSGKVNFENDAEVSFGTGGRIAKIYIKKGDWVKKGDLIAQMETENLDLALDQAKLNVAQLELTLKESLKQSAFQIAQAESSLTVAQFNLDRTEAVRDIKDEITKLENQIEISKTLLKERTAINSNDSVSFYLSQINTAELQLLKKQKKLSDLLTGPEMAGTATYEFDGQEYDRLVVEDVRLKQQQVELAKKALDQIDQTNETTHLSLAHAKQAVVVAEKQIRDATIYSPIEGKIIDLNVRIGDVISSTGLNMSKLVYIIDTSSIHIDSQIDEIDIPSVSEGQKVIISLDSAPNTKYEGIVNSISLQPVANIQNAGVVVYEVKIDFVKPPPASVKLGMSATVDIVTDQRTNVLLIPSRTIKDDAEGNSVVDVLVNDKIESREIQIGITDGVNTEVLKGLTETDMLVIIRATTNSLGLFGQ